MSEQHRRDPRAVPRQDQPPLAVSRRTLVKTAAGAGVAAATVGIVGVAHAAGDPVASTPPAGATATNGPLVVHVTDASRGDLEIFTDGLRTQVTDADLAGRIVRAATKGR